MRRLITAILLVAGAATAMAQTELPSTENGRYAMTPVAEGFLRLDTRTGAVSLCRVAGSSVECRAGAEESRALHDEIERLSRENADLKSRLAGVRPDSKYGLPSDADIDRALGIGEKFMKRMLNLFRDSTGDRT